MFCRDCLCCKSGAEFEQYYSEKEFGSENTLSVTGHHTTTLYTSLYTYHTHYLVSRWFCHVDDDVYVNTRQLIALLEQYNPLEETVYLGRWSLNQKSKMQVRIYTSGHCMYILIGEKIEKSVHISST